MNPLVFKLLKKFAIKFDSLDQRNSEIDILITLKNKYLFSYLELISKYCNLPEDNYAVQEKDLMDNMEKFEIALIAILEELIDVIDGRKKCLKQ